MEIKETNPHIFEKTARHLPKHSLSNYLIGRPLPTADAPDQTISKVVGLAVFSSDAMSSVAYGPQELMMILVAAGMSALPVSFPIVCAIVALLFILTFSYEQTIHAYPDGGGAYIVSRDNLGELPAQIAAAALLTDYILTVAVSISSGVAQLISALPDLFPYRVGIAVVMIILITVINLRGVKESGTAFAIPTYIFLVLIYITVTIGFVRYLTGTLGTVVDPPELETGLVQPLTLFLILRAFANGTASLTGVEAISNGVQAFRKPHSKNAGITLMWMSGILASLLLAITFLSIQIGAHPVEGETLISQLARTVFGGRGLMYLLTISGTTVILIMAANTAFAGFPRLGALTALDGYIPRQLAFRGSRLVYSYGIALLAVIASLLVIGFQASVTSLIPLYAIGVFLSFSLSQAGMARRWWKSGHLKPGEKFIERGSTVTYDRGWHYKMFINGVGAVCTAVVMIIFAVTKFQAGAWVVIALLPLLVMLFRSIHRHYTNLARKLSLANDPHLGIIKRNRVIMPVSGVHTGILVALRFARRLSDDITAVHVSIDPDETAKLEEKWLMWGEGYRMVVLNSPYRLLIEPLLEYIDEIDSTLSENEIITIVVPQFVPKHFYENWLHMNTAENLRRVLLRRENIVITEVPYQVG